MRPLDAVAADQGGGQCLDRAQTERQADERAECDGVEPSSVLAEVEILAAADLSLHRAAERGLGDGAMAVMRDRRAIANGGFPARLAEPQPEVGVFEKDEEA